MRRPARLSLVALAALTCLVSLPRGRPLHAQAPRPVSVVATGVTEDSTASNNQVKMVRAPAGLVVAYAKVAGGTAQIFLAVSPDDGVRWSSLAQVSSGPARSRLPTLALDASGRLHVIWTRDDDGVGKIYYRVWAGRWAAPQARISPSLGYAGYPALALDRAGDPQVVWYGIRDGTVPAPTRHGSIYEIYYTGYDGHAWARPMLISTGLPDSINPTMAADPAGRLHAAWYQFDGRTYEIRYAERDGVWGPPEGVVRARADEFNPDIAAQPQGEVSLVWERHLGQRSTIYYTHRTQGRWDDPVALSGGDVPAHHPSVTATPRGEIYVAWDQDDGEIYLRRYAGRWGRIIRLTSDAGNTFPALAADGAAVDAVWTHTQNARSAVYFTRLLP